jgi:hypothetical protein
MLRLKAGRSTAVVDPVIGNIPDLTIGGIDPLHRAPWYGTIDDVNSIPAVERRLAGDFLCMPFGRSDVTDDPQHGHTANAPWKVLETEAHRVHLRLSVKVMGATVEKEVRLARSAPLLYQSHEIDGGEGRVTLAHHPMVRMAAGGRLAFSPKRAILSPERPLQPGHAIFAPGARSTKVTAFPAPGGAVDLTHYPTARGEDFLTLVEEPGSRLGWTAVTRAAENDIIFVLKDPEVLPVTMLWFSNGGRDAAPWSGRHTGVLGIEDGIAAGADGHRAALGDNPVRAEGVETALTLGPRHVIRHVIGAIAKPPGWATVTAIRREAGQLLITGDTDETVSMGFSAGFL